MRSLSGHSSLIIIYIGLGYGKACCQERTQERHVFFVVFVLKIRTLF